MTTLRKSGVIRIENFRHIIVPHMDQLERMTSA
jgi:CRP/FNR family transcriptional regulator